MVAASDTAGSSGSPGAAAPISGGFLSYASASAVVTGLASLAYAVAFLIVKNLLYANLFLALGGFLSFAALTALYLRVRQVDDAFALYGLVLALVSALGVTVHGVYGLANALVPPAAGAPNLDALPFQLDPRGLLAFGLAGAGVGALSALTLRSGLPRGLGYVGLLNGVALVALFLGDLFTGTDTKSLAILIPGGLTSLILTPLWYIWLGVTLGRRK